MTRDELITLLAERDPLRAARVAAVPPVGEVTFTRAAPPPDWLVDVEQEGPIRDHRAAHAQGRPSEAVVAYGAGVPEEAVADRLLQLAALARESGLLRAVTPVPAEGSPSRPGSWGVEDLVVVAAARAVLPEGTRVRPCWPRLGPGAAQVAVAFGATDWQIPADDATDPHHLAAGVGRRAVER